LTLQDGLSDVRFYDDVLSAAEIASLANGHARDLRVSRSRFKLA
jgi:hypothetical protein